MLEDKDLKDQIKPYLKKESDIDKVLDIIKKNSYLKVVEASPYWAKLRVFSG